MEVKLRVLNGKSAGQELSVSGPRFSIGRGEGCQLRPRSDAIAEQHCELDIQPATVTLRNLTSTGITLVNGQPIADSCALKTGDKLKVGPLEFEVLLKIGVAAKKKPKVKSVEEAATRMAAAPKKDEFDVSQWIGDGPDDTPAASRYAASLNEAERKRLGIKLPGEEESEESTATPQAAKPAPEEKEAKGKTAENDSGLAAAQMLNKMRRRT